MFSRFNMVATLEKYANHLKDALIYPDKIENGKNYYGLYQKYYKKGKLVFTYYYEKNFLVGRTITKRILQTNNINDYKQWLFNLLQEFNIKNLDIFC